MLLIRLSGHSGAGKSRLLAALSKKGLPFTKPVLYTSRQPRPGETDGVDYFFRSENAIRNLPSDRYFVGPVREMWQAVDLDQLERDCLNNTTIIIEIFQGLWPGLIDILKRRIRNDLPVRSVFLTAIDPEALVLLSREEAATEIRTRVLEILEWRAKDSPESMQYRADSAIDEVLTALTDPAPYDDIIVSAPEGPDNQDEWTSEASPTGLAEHALNQFLSIMRREE